MRLKIGPFPTPFDIVEEVRGSAGAVGSLTIDVLLDGTYDINTGFIPVLELEAAAPVE